MDGKIKEKRNNKRQQYEGDIIRGLPLMGEALLEGSTGVHLQSNLPIRSPPLKQSPVLKGHLFLVLS